MSKRIYKLGLHESYKDDNMKVTRIPGGWIYELVDEENKYNQPVFVPYSKEYKGWMSINSKEFSFKDIFGV